MAITERPMTSSTLTRASSSSFEFLLLSFKLHKMRSNKTKTGFTLVELLTVVAVILLLAVVGLPAAKKVLNSFESSLSVRYLISAALANARAIAARQQAYAGLRFQQALDGNQYMTFIVHDEAATNLAYGFRAVVGYKPMKLPENVCVMDGRLVERDLVGFEVETEDVLIDGDDLINDPCELTETNTFSIVFSPAGKLAIHRIWVRNRDGRTDDSSNDSIFNTENNVRAGIGMFIEDDNEPWPLRLGQEPSRNNFVIYDKRALDAVNEGSRWTDYLQHLEVIYISPYTGQIINK